MWHYHEYYEVFAVRSGSGSWRIGDNQGCFGANELFLIGPGIPHAFYHGTGEAVQGEVEADVIMFQLRCDLMPELQALSGLLEKAAGGLIFHNPGHGLFSRIKALEEVDGIAGLASLFLFLADLSKKEGEQVLTVKADYQLSSGKSDRLDMIFSYLHTNFYRDLKLEHIAAKANMSIPGLCSFFKRMTKTPVLVYVHQLRISLACRLLRDTDQPVLTIASRCGYNSLSSFNRMFKSMKNCSPREFRKMNI